MNVRSRAELGTDSELMTLVAKIRGFDHETATPDENLALAQALKLVAQDIVLRHEEVVTLQRRLNEKLAVAEVAGELAGVINTIRPAPSRAPRRPWFFR